MPLDYRRFNGPEDSVSYKIYTKDYIKPYEERYNELLDENGLRKDGRALNEARSMFARTDMVSQAKGSSYVEFKKTRWCALYLIPGKSPIKMNSVNLVKYSVR